MDEQAANSIECCSPAYTLETTPTGDQEIWARYPGDEKNDVKLATIHAQEDNSFAPLQRAMQIWSLYTGTLDGLGK